MSFGRILIRTCVLAFTLTVVSPYSALASSITKESAYEIGDAYQMKNVSNAVKGMVGDEVNKYLKGKVKEWTIEAFEEVGRDATDSGSQGLANRSGLANRGDERKKEAIKQRLKEKIKERLPDLAKKVLYEKLFLGKFGDEVEEVREIVDRIVTELKVNFNDRADQIISGWYDKAMAEIDDYLKYKAGPLDLDLTHVRETLNKALRLENVEWGLTQALSEAVGESTANGIRNRMKDVLSGRLPPEAIKYLDYGPDKFAEYASKIEAHLPGKEFDMLKDKLLHTPLFVLPNSIYGGILASSAVRHYAQAIQSWGIDINEIIRGNEVTRVLIWQMKTKEGLSIDLASLLDAVKLLSDKFGISLDDLGRLGENIKDAKEKLAELEGKLDKLDNLVKGKIDKVGKAIESTVGEIKGKLLEFQNTLFKPVIDAYKDAGKLVKDVNKTVMDSLPENLYGIPGNWEDFKKQAGIKDGVFGKIGELSPWDAIQKFITDSGMRDAYEKAKKDLKKVGEKINDAVSGALAGAATEVVDAFGFTDSLGRALSIEDMPAENPPVENPTDPVLLHNGEFYHQVIDLLIPGRRLNYEFKRTYRSRADFKGVMGYNWAHNYEERLVTSGDKVFYIDSEGRKFVFGADKTAATCAGFANGSADDKKLNGCAMKYISPPGIFSTLQVTQEGEYVLDAPDGLKTYFGRGGLMSSREDRFGNSIEFEYDKFGRLIKVVDPLKRPITYSYNASGLLDEVKDFSGRSVTLTYDSYSDLAAVTGPKSFDFPDGKTVRYSYSSGFFAADRLNHNLVLIMDPKGEIYLRNTYGEEGIVRDRVVAQQYGDGQKMQINYQPLRPAFLWRFMGKGANEAVSSVEVTDRRGISHFYDINANGNILKEEYADGGVRRQKIQYQYNDEGLRVKMVYPSGRAVQFAYNNKSLLRPAMRNLLEQRDIAAGGVEERITKFVYEPVFNQPKMVVSPLGERIVWFYDNEERDFGDINGDGDVGGRKGLLMALQLDGGDGSKEKSVYKYRYDSYGQKIAAVDPVGVVTMYEYYPDGGYLKSVIVDAEDHASRLATGNILSAAATFKYDAVGNITNVTNPTGSTTSYTVNSPGQVMEEISPLAYVKKYIFDANDNLVQVILDNRGGANAQEVGSQLVYKYEYDVMDNLLKKDEPLGKGVFVGTSYTYNPNGDLIGVAFPEGNGVEYGYNGAGRIVSVIRGKGTADEQVVQIGYDVGDNPIRVQNGERALTSYSYNGFGELTQEVDPLGGRHEMIRDLIGRIKGERRWSSKGELIAETEYVYNYQGRVVEDRQHLFGGQSQGDGWASEKSEYNSAGLLTSYTDANGAVTYYEYNGLGKLAEAVLPDKMRIEYNYDPLGLLISRVEYPPDGQAAVTSFSYDEEGMPREAKDPLGGGTRLAYDSRGNLIERQDPLGSKTQYDYDGLGRRTAVRQQVDKEKWITTRYVWDGNGRLTSLIDDNGKTTTFQYDRLDRKVSEAHPEGDVVSYRYDKVGNLAAMKDSNGTVVHQFFDPLGQLISRKVNRGNDVDGTTMQDFRYDDLGRLIYSYDNNNPDILEDDATNFYFYDSLSNLTADIQNGRQVARMINPGGKVNVIKYPSQRIHYRQYDPENRLTGLFWESQLMAELGYDSRGRLVDYDTGGGVSLTQSYDLLGRLEGQRYQKGDEGIVDTFRYAYDLAGRLKLKTDEKGRWDAYDYDGAGRLVLSLSGNEAVNPSADKWDAKALIPRAREVGRWELDGVGNRQGREGPLEYGKSGNLIADGKFRYIYDGLNRLINVIDPDGKVIANYSYDVHNRRVFKRVGTNVVQYIYDGWNVIEEFEDGKPARSYVHGDLIDNPVAMIDNLNGGKVYYYHQDYLGSVTALSDADGNVVQRYSYQPHGEVYNSSDISGPFDSQPYTFTARSLDRETGLMYFRNRYYSPRLGRFVTRDPLGYKTSVYTKGEARLPFHLSFHRRRNLHTYPNNFHWLASGEYLQGTVTGDVGGVARFNRWFRRPFGLMRTGEMNLYAYAGLDPVNRRDPMGLDYLWVTGEYVPDSRGSGRYADLQVIWVEETGEGEGDDMRAEVVLPLYNAVSGPWKRGPLPSGDYKGSYIRERKGNVGMSIDGFGWSLDIDPQFDTNRSLLRIHPDGNAFGSRGCIAVDRDGYRQLYDRLNDYLGGNSSIDVHVRIRGQGEDESEMDGGLDMLIRKHAEILTNLQNSLNREGL